MAYLLDRRSPATLGDVYRANQAFDRQVFRGRTRLGALPDLSQPIQVQPTTLLVGIGALALGLFLLGGKIGPQMKAKKVARLASQRASISKRIKELES